MKTSKGNPSFVDFEAVVVAAKPIARQMLLEGIDFGGRTEQMLDERMAAVCAAVGLTEAADLSELAEEIGEEAYSVFVQRLEAACAIGIAIGHLTRPELFSKASAR
jgi:hypothetical protein